MAKISKSMDVPELGVVPPLAGAIRLSEDMQQTLALLTGYDDTKRVLLKASESGVLAVASRRIADILHFTGSGPNDQQIGDNLDCTDVMVVGHPGNTGLIWVRPDEAATANNALPIAANGALSFTIDNMNQLNLLIVTDGDKAIAVYTR